MDFNNDKVRINPLELPNVKCEECENLFFEKVTIIKKVSKLLTGSPTDELVPMETYVLYMKINWPGREMSKLLTDEEKKKYREQYKNREVTCPLCKAVHKGLVICGTIGTRRQEQLMRDFHNQLVYVLGFEDGKAAALRDLREKLDSPIFMIRKIAGSMGHESLGEYVDEISEALSGGGRAYFGSNCFACQYRVGCKKPCDERGDAK